MTYVIITGAYNEERYIECTIQSVLKQTCLPVEWIFVNDNSTDNTESIICQFVKKYPWIKLINKRFSSNEFGPHAVHNFNYGIENLSSSAYNFIIKLDADLSIDRVDYFEFQLKEFSKNAKLGISSGITYYYLNNKKVLAYHPWWQTTGALKMYRKECLADIGGLSPILGWDGLDTYKAMYRGWETRTFYELQVNHLGKGKDIKRKDNNNFYYEQGISYSRRGYSLAFIILKLFKYLIRNDREKAISFFLGFWNARKCSKYVTKNEQRFIRNFQIKRVFLKKRYE